MKKNTRITAIIVFLMLSVSSYAQKVNIDSVLEVHKDSVWKHSPKNIIRYNLSSALLFGFDKVIVLGYERVLSPRRSFSVNFGKAGLPKLVSIVTDSFSINKDAENKGFNISIDYRFYLSKENKYAAPHGLYIGPYYSFNKLERTNTWKGISSTNTREINTNVDLQINMVGVELGYQFIFWKRLAVDMVLVGPSLGFYNLKATAKGNFTPEEREQLYEALQQALEQKIPGFDFVFEDNALAANGVSSNTNIGFRYIIHVGFRF